MSSDVKKYPSYFTECFQVWFDDNVGGLFVRHNTLIGYYLAVLRKQCLYIFFGTELIAFA
jgi:hypothetical protein